MRLSSRVATIAAIWSLKRVGAAVAGQADVDRSRLIDPQAAEVAFDALAQLVRIDPLDGLDLGKFGLAQDRFGDWPAS
jgi:hypothetical protein